MHKVQMSKQVPSGRVDWHMRNEVRGRSGETRTIRRFQLLLFRVPSDNVQREC